MLNRSDNSFLLPSLISITCSSSFSCFMSSLSPLFRDYPLHSVSFSKHIPRVPPPQLPISSSLCLFDKSGLFEDPSVTLLASKLLHLQKKKKLNSKGWKRKEVRVRWKIRTDQYMPNNPHPPALCDFMLAASLPRCTPSLSCLFAQLIFPLLYMPSEAAAH